MLYPKDAIVFYFFFNIPPSALIINYKVLKAYLVSGKSYIVTRIKLKLYAQGYMA